MLMTHHQQQGHIVRTREQQLLADRMADLVFLGRRSGLIARVDQQFDGILNRISHVEVDGLGPHIQIGVRRAGAEIHPHLHLGRWGELHQAQPAHGIAVAGIFHDLCHNTLGQAPGIQKIPGGHPPGFLSQAHHFPEQAAGLFEVGHPHGDGASGCNHSLRFLESA